MKKENEYLEFKKTTSQLKEGVISLCSMLNKHNRGELYFGINDEGKAVRFDISKKTLSDITNEIRTNLKPMPSSVEIEEVQYDGFPVVKVSVEGNDTPYSAYGRYYIRIDDSDNLMTGNQLEQFFDQKNDIYSKWENKTAEYSYDDMDEDLVIDVIRRANDKGRLNYVFRNIREAFAKLNLADEDGNIKTAGYYLFSKTKPLTIKEANYPTDSRTEFGEIKEFRGNIFECIHEAVTYVQNHISYKSTIVGLQREEEPEIPVVALREIIINSFAHAKYEVKGDYNQYIVYRSTVRIYNPGSMYKDLDPMKFASSEVGSKIRNPLIASVLYKSGLIDAFGTGFDRTFTLCIKNGIDYDYRNDDFGFTFIFHRKIDYLNDEINDKINDKINEIEKAILGQISINKYITINELADVTGKSVPTVYRYLKQLMKDGRLKRMESRKSGYWELI